MGSSLIRVQSYPFRLTISGQQFETIRNRILDRWLTPWARLLKPPASVRRLSREQSTAVEYQPYKPRVGHSRLNLLNCTGSTPQSPLHQLAAYHLKRYATPGVTQVTPPIPKIERAHV